MDDFDEKLRWVSHLSGAGKPLSCVRGAPFDLCVLSVRPSMLSGLDLSASGLYVVCTYQRFAASSEYEASLSLLHVYALALRSILLTLAANHCCSTNATSTYDPFRTSNLVYPICQGLRYCSRSSSFGGNTVHHPGAAFGGSILRGRHKVNLVYDSRRSSVANVHL